MRTLGLIIMAFMFSCQATPLVMSQTSMLVAKGQKQQLNVKQGILDKTAAATWSSSNVGAATVDTNGLVTGVACGTTTVTAVLNGLTATAQVQGYVPLKIQAVDGNGNVIQPVNGIYQVPAGGTLQLQTTGGC